MFMRRVDDVLGQEKFSYFHGAYACGEQRCLSLLLFSLQLTVWIGLVLYSVVIIPSSSCARQVFGDVFCSK